MNTVMSIKIDKETKEAAQQVAQSAGISLSTLVKVYLRQVVATRRIELYAPEPMTPKLESLIADIEKEITAGKVSKTFSSPESMLAQLKKR